MSGYVQFAKPINYETIKTDIEKRIANQRSAFATWQKVTSAIKRWDGKKLTKRTTDALTKELGTPIRFRYVAGMTYLIIKDGEYEHQIFLGHDNTHHHDLYLSNYSAPYQSCKEDADKLESGLSMLQEFVDRYNALLQFQQTLQTEAEKFGYDYDFDIVCKEKR